MRAGTHQRVTVYLDASEQFEFQTRTGKIRVRQLTFQPSDFQDAGRAAAWARGPGIKVDGTEALINREDLIPFKKIPLEVLELVVTTINEHPKVSFPDYVRSTESAYGEAEGVEA